MKTGYWDIHNHILPGIDDGSCCMEETHRLLETEYKQGVRNIIFTPHHRPDIFRVEVADRERIFMDTLRETQPEFPDMAFYLGCEYHAGERLLRDVADSRYRMAGSVCILLEFSAADRYDRIRESVKGVTGRGYIPVIAHPERYRCLQNDPSGVGELRRAGALLQVNADSILGKEGKAQKQFCRLLLEQDLADFVASDAHDPRLRPARLGECAQKIEKKYGAEKADWLFRRHPSMIFRDE